MACSCGSKGGGSYIVTKGDGTTETRNTQVEAAALAARTGGTYRRA
jgi:hypothetical protein